MKNREMRKTELEEVTDVFSSLGWRGGGDV